MPGTGGCVRAVAGGIDVATIRRIRSIQKVLAHIACGETCPSLTRIVPAYDAMQLGGFVQTTFEIHSPVEANKILTSRVEKKYEKWSPSSSALARHNIRRSIVEA